MRHARAVGGSADVLLRRRPARYGAGATVPRQAALSITSGEQTTYTGTVGSIAEADYAANLYQWGIFTYAQNHQDREFEVINYWVQ